MADAVVLTGIVRPTGRSKRPIVAGFRVDASLLRAVTIEDGDDETIAVLATGSGVVDADGAFRLSIEGDGTPEPPITVTVSTADGVQVHRSEITLEQASRPLTLSVRGLPPLEIEPSEDPGRGNPVILTGRVIDDQGRAVPAGLPVVLWGALADTADGDAPTPHPLVITQTQAGGYFSGDWVANTLTTAFGRVDGSAPIPVRLDDAHRLPLRVLLVLDLALPDGGDAPSAKPPSVPSPDDLVNNPAAFSQDLGRGCVDLTTPNRAIEEFTYTMVVRTSEPDVKGLTLGVRKVVPRKALAQLVEASLLQETLERGAVASRDLSGLRDLALDVTSAKHLVAGDNAPSVAEITRAAWLSDVGRVKDLISVAVTDPVVRRPLDAGHPIDWDATPTIYQAITIARGHILELREVWRADGYSLGDLLYSLPLAPGQRRQVAVVDWERRSTTTRQEALEFEEELQSFVGRDRDVSEIVGSRLSEDTAAASKNKTWGMAGGIGAGFIGSGFGIFGGVAGSSGGSSSTAWQDSARQFSADSLQSLRDRVMQRASAVRDERSTVVQTAAQGETMRAETETVANYNHCHAMTVEYFEVLRHFLITHEVADVRECLFVPLPMSEFDAAKALRWQTPLARRLRDRGLVAGFDALRRAADNWVGWNYPLSRYSEEPPEEVEGELRVSFVFPRPRDGQDGAFQIDFWKPYRSWLWMDPFELWTAQIERGIAAANAGAIAERDRQSASTSRPRSPSASSTGCGSPTSRPLVPRSSCRWTARWSRATPRARRSTSACALAAACRRSRASRSPSSRSASTAASCRPTRRSSSTPARRATGPSTRPTSCSTTAGSSTTSPTATPSSSPPRCRGPRPATRARRTCASGPTSSPISTRRWSTTTRPSGCGWTRSGASCSSTGSSSPASPAAASRRSLRTA
jgi:hypothetical protein